VIVKKPMVQCLLTSHSMRRTCWLAVEKGLRVGASVTLKDSGDPDRRWEVLTMSEPKERRELHTDWKVGGL
jgi:lactam utilization protein B